MKRQRVPAEDDPLLSDEDQEASNPYVDQNPGEADALDDEDRQFLQEYIAQRRIQQQQEEEEEEEQQPQKPQLLQVPKKPKKAKAKRSTTRKSNQWNRYHEIHRPLLVQRYPHLSHQEIQKMLSVNYNVYKEKLKENAKKTKSMQQLATMFQDIQQDTETIKKLLHEVVTAPTPTTTAAKGAVSDAEEEEGEDLDDTKEIDDEDLRRSQAAELKKAEEAVKQGMEKLAKLRGSDKASGDIHNKAIITTDPPLPSAPANP